MTDKLTFNYLESEANSKATLFQEVVNWQKKHQFISNVDNVVAELNYREKVGTTMLEDGIALPHVSNQLVKENNVLLVKVVNPISQWDQGYQVDTCLFLFLQPVVNQDIRTQVKRIMISLADSDNVTIFRSFDLEKIQALIK